MVICLLRGASCLHVVQPMLLSSQNVIILHVIRIQNGFYFSDLAYPGYSGKEAIKYALVLSCTVCIVFAALASIAFSLAHFHLSQVSLCITRWFVLCSSAVKSASVMSAATTSDSSPQSLGSGSERMVSIRADYDRRSAMSSLDDMDAGYPSRLVCLVSHISV